MFPHGRPAHILGPAPPRPPTGEQLSVDGLDSNSSSSHEDDREEPGRTVSSDSESSDSDFAPSPRSRQKCRKLPSAGSTKVINNRIPVPWIDYGVVRGWAAVLAIFEVFSLQCDCTPIMSRSGHANKDGVTYRMECAYANRLGCGWQCRVVIWFDQNLAAEEYLQKHPEAPSLPGFVALDRTKYQFHGFF